MTITFAPYNRLKTEIENKFYAIDLVDKVQIKLETARLLKYFFDILIYRHATGTST